MNFEITLDDNTIKLNVDFEHSVFAIENSSRNYSLEYVNKRYILRVGTKVYQLDNISIAGPVVSFSINGQWISATVKDEQELLLDKLGFKTHTAINEGVLNAPMPGKILSIMAETGNSVEKGQALVILEAMKMENELKAPISGKIKAIHAEEGQSLEKNTPILEIEP